MLLLACRHTLAISVDDIFFFGMSVNDNFFSFFICVCRSLFLCLLHSHSTQFYISHYRPISFHLETATSISSVLFAHHTHMHSHALTLRHTHVEWNKWSTSLNYEINWPISNLKFITRNIYSDENCSILLLLLLFACLVCSEIQWTAFY